MEVIYRVKSMDVRSMCITYDYYTCGDCKAYDRMFSKCHKAKTPEDIYLIAVDIWEHSDQETFMDECGEYSEKECIRMIANQIMNDCSFAEIKF